MLSEKVFNSTFIVSHLDELPNEQIQRFYYPDNLIGKDGIILSIIPENKEKWIGVFEFGKIDNGLSGVYSHPNQDYICIISNGSGYIVNSKNPEEWEEIKLIPIIDVQVIEEKNIIIFAGLTELCAYNSNGLLWISSRISWDSLTINGNNGTVIKGKYYDMRVEDYSEFEVDIETGNVKGGVE